MFWEENDRKDDMNTSDKVVDVSYKIDCKQLPASHAMELAHELYTALPWLKHERQVGIHQIHGATTGNGWERPANSELMYLSRRTRMQLRIPLKRVDDARQLTGREMHIAGEKLIVGEMITRQINPLSTLFSRYVVVPQGSDETEFLQWVMQQMKQRDIRVKKMLCGMGHAIEVEGKTLETRSLMVADLDKTTSVLLQEEGLGLYQHYGCGLFIPHKGIKAVGEMEDKSHFSGS